MIMTTPRALASLSLLTLVLLSGLVASKPSVAVATGAGLLAATRSEAAPQETKASARQDAAAAVDAANPLTSAREAVIASMHNLMKARSYHVSMKMSDSSKGMLASEVDFVAPDRFRIVMDSIGTQIIIGNTMHMSMQGRSMKVPMPKNAIDKWRDPGNFKQAEAGMTAESLGSESVDGISAKKYKVMQTVPEKSESTLWIGSNGMPLQMRINTKTKGAAGTMTMRYSRINDPTLTIEAPK